MLFALSMLSPALAGGVVLDTVGVSADFVPPSILVAAEGPLSLHVELGHPPEPGSEISSEIVSMDLTGEEPTEVTVGLSMEASSAVVPAGSCGLSADLVVVPSERPVALPDCGDEPLTLLVRSDGGTAVFLDVRVTTGAGFSSPTDLVGFNPQPEPPGFPFALGLEATFERGAQHVDVEVALSDESGRSFVLR